MHSLPFKIKICGVRSVQDLPMLAAAGVDAVGLNFVTTSPRSVSLNLGIELANAARQLGLIVVAVTMNETQTRFDEIVERVAADYVQLHGMESPESFLHLSEGSIVKAVSWSGREVEQQLAEKWATSKQLAAFLVDAYAPGLGGGSGRVARWDLLCPRPKSFGDYPLILAGGLTPENLHSAIAATGCEAIDAASGVEDRPGEKNASLVTEFVRSARIAFQSGQ